MKARGKMAYKLLDLFCGAGGTSMGYHRAGFVVYGVDNKLQPHYPSPLISISIASSASISKNGKG